MKLRSNRRVRSPPPIEGDEKPQCDNSDEEDDVPSADSYNGEDSFNIVEGVESLDLNEEASDADSDYADGLICNKSRKRRIGSMRKSGRSEDMKEEVRIEGVEYCGVNVELPDLNEEANDADHDYAEYICNIIKKRRMGSTSKRGELERIEGVEDSGVNVEVPEAQHHAEVNEVTPVEVPQKKKRRGKRQPKPILLWEIWEEENEKWIDEHICEDADLTSVNEVVNETAEASSDLTMPLLRYQKEWLAWALKQEESATRGGILADEMGMGKTIQAIALVLAKREICEPDEPSPSPSSSIVLPKLKCTLVICPLVAVTQWESEINRFTVKGSTKVLVYHGGDRGKNVHQFSEYDFIITTYSIVETEFRKNVMAPKQKCLQCGKSFHQRKMLYHLKYYCGPDAVRTEKQSKQARKEEGKQKQKMLETTEAAKKWNVSKKNWKQFKKETDTEFKSGGENSADAEHGSPSRKSILHFIKWERIILDEAHSIKDRRSNTAKAIFALESSYKWALSGTPLQNRVGELYSLVRFLQIVPYAYYLCKDCDCRMLDYSSSSQCSNCAHKCVRHFCWWNKYVANPIQASGRSDCGKRAMILLTHKLLKGILLRRTKKGRAADLALPPRIVSLRRDALDIKEEDYYKSLYNESQAQFNTYIQEGTLGNNYAHIFDLLTRLRQAVDHPYLVVYSRTAAMRRESMVNNNNNEPCGICNEPAEDVVVTSCMHAFCKACLIDYSETLGQVSCPSCSKALTVDLTSSMDHNIKTSVKGYKSSSIINRIQLEDFQTSTKIDALREEIRFMIERDGAAKGIVFSQFTSFLDLINYSLLKSGVTCAQLVGSMSMSARDAAITRFTEDPDCKIFLMSLKAGGVALNLTVASHVFLMDPWWNPAVERQAQDRIHRIGQYKPIRIVRFVIENTIEERILKLQEKKELVFEGTVGGCPEALGKLTADDLRFLFNN